MEVTPSPATPAPILVVDDEADLLDIFAKRLVKAGFDVTTACTGRDALRLLGERGFRVVICDINMPGGVTGFDVLDRLRSLPGHASTGFVFVTGHGEGTPELERALSLGVDGVYSKPISSKTLISHLRQLCGIPESTPAAAAP